MLTLHYARGTVAAAAAIALNEAGLDYDRERVDFSTGAQRSPSYRKINPKGRVPALEVAGKGILTEVIAILEYAAARAPDARLVPPDLFEAAVMRSVMAYLASTMHVNHAHGSRGARWADDPASIADMKAKVTETMTESAAFIETHALRGPFVMGQAFSLADPYLFVVSTWLAGDGVDVAAFPKLDAFQRRMWDRPSVRVALSDGFL